MHIGLHNGLCDTRIRLSSSHGYVLSHLDRGIDDLIISFDMMMVLWCPSWPWKCQRR